MLPVQLAIDEEIGSRPFTASDQTGRDGSVMQQMLERLRALAPEWNSDHPDFLVCEPDVEGHRHWIRVPNCPALLAARRLTAVGFFGQVRDDVDQVPIHELEAGIVGTLETIGDVLCYYDLALAAGGYGNLILCATADAPKNVHGHAMHQRAVQLAPSHYHSVRLHTGAVPGAFLGDAKLVIERTRYYDYDSKPPWLAVRDLT